MILYFALQRFKKIFFWSVVFFFGSFFFSSCKITSQSQYFKNLQKDTTLTGFTPNNFESKIKKGDQLSITVTSLNPAEDILFNGATISGDASKSFTAGGNTVMQDGTVLLHRLGNVTAEGFTRKEFAVKLQKDLLAFLKEPIVKVAYLNHTITILGEVGKPQVFALQQEQISLIDALVLSGDITAIGKRNDVTIIRENGSEKQVKHINLEDNSVFSSAWYYLQPNDIVLVNADTDKYIKEEKRRKLQTNLSLAASGISLLLIILSRVVK